MVPWLKHTHGVTQSAVLPTDDITTPLIEDPTRKEKKRALTLLWRNMKNMSPNPKTHGQKMLLLFFCFFCSFFNYYSSLKSYTIDRTVFLYDSGLQSAWRIRLGEGVWGGDGWMGWQGPRNGCCLPKSILGFEIWSLTTKKIKFWVPFVTLPSFTVPFFWGVGAGVWCLPRETLLACKTLQRLNPSLCSSRSCLLVSVCQSVRRLSKLLRSKQ